MNFNNPFCHRSDRNTKSRNVPQSNEVYLRREQQRITDDRRHRMQQAAELRGRALEEEPRARRLCDMGVGCEEYGVCYAEAHNEPERCGRSDK